MSGSNAKNLDTSNSQLHCSFCAKSQDEVSALVAGPGVYICNHCNEAASAYISKFKDLSEKEAKSMADTAQEQLYSHLTAKPPEELLEFLVNVERTRIDIDTHQQNLVDILRAKRMPWVEIGGALGVTRQAAWQRFGAAD